MPSVLRNVRLNEPAYTSQTEGSDFRQFENAAGGYVFPVNEDAQFRRFLTIGTTGGTYYVGESKLTEDNARFVAGYIERHGVKAVEEIVNVSTSALAPKNSQALFALAVAMNSSDNATKQAAKSAVNKVARTSTHLFEFAQYLKNNGGLGRAKTSALANWYESKNSDQIAFQSVKYRQRDGWTHRDVLRISHAKNLDENVVNFMLKKPYDNTKVPTIINTFENLQSASNVRDVVKILKSDKNAPWELIPTEFLKYKSVWKQLFENGIPQTALLRNTKRVHNLGLFDDMKFAANWANALADEKRIQRGKMHPIQFLNAYGAYAGSASQNFYWNDLTGVTNPNEKIISALETGYFKAFGNIQPANKRTLISLDVSGSMNQKASGLNISCAMFGGSLCQTISKTEPYSKFMGFAREYRELGITPSDSLKTVAGKAVERNFGGTDTALPMHWALKNNIEVDTFIIVTDNDTWAGNEHTHEALARYRKRTGISSRFICVATTSTNYTVSDPDDALSLDISGSDASTPKMITDFSAGRI